MHAQHLKRHVQYRRRHAPAQLCATFLHLAAALNKHVPRHQCHAQCTSSVRFTCNATSSDCLVSSAFVHRSHILEQNPDLHQQVRKHPDNNAAEKQLHNQTPAHVRLPNRLKICQPSTAGKDQAKLGNTSSCNQSTTDQHRQHLKLDTQSPALKAEPMAKLGTKFNPRG